MFKLAIFERGRFLRLDDSTFAKDRFDYARILLATSSLEVLNISKSILIDGELVELKIIEEWGFAIGEDACLLDDDADSKALIPDKCYDTVAPEISDQVDNLVNNLADDWATDIELDECQHFSNIPYDNNKEEGTVKVVGVCELEATSKKKYDTDVPIKTIDSNTLQKVEIFGQDNKQLTGTDAQGAVVKIDSHHFVESSKTSLRRKRQNSCPPRVTRSINSGPWSIEWLQDQVYGDVGVVSSSKKASKIKKNI